ncbi:MAG: tRNA (adenosine(37)-N6)-threonylcarbamoyltransferase complex ATPase subunit type 1 TsaE [Candidatus Omnitrophica bacterium]|nr:tRNA (adenosine(37)-N6)-threonylcarbamoyltransferase complex ATPase subunit type 1 TsaE [Candidatus Omnitrophota bacterium]
MSSSRNRVKSWTDGYEVVAGSVEETQALGERIGVLLQPGDVVALHGELGSGKTTLIQGLARGLGCEPQQVKSPTFVLVREYAGRIPMIHVDGYRLEGPSAAAGLDVDLLFAPSTVTVIEWAERLAQLLPPELVEVLLSHVSTNRRRVRVSGVGARAQAVLSALQASQRPSGATGRLAEASGSEPAEQPEAEHPL